LAAATIAVPHHELPPNAHLRGKIGMWCLITAESAIFLIFVVAYLYYAGKSISGPTPAQVLEVPWLASICLFSSSATIMLAEKAIEKGDIGRFRIFWFLTIALGAFFLVETGREWYRLIYEHGLTIQRNLFGTTYYSLVGLHAFHVTVGLIGLTTILIFALLGAVKQEHSYRINVFAMYWHFVDVIWVVVLSVVYFIAR
jgi:cytochrome c oxidase subunit 3/cytochrome o ubiquinol oxidase subunit 3